VEILSPDDTAREVREKVDEYLAHGVRLIWVVDPEDRTVAIYRVGTPPARLDASGVLTGGDVLPGFSCQVGTLFP
jgi:Uma2 family endonuclease